MTDVCVCVCDVRLTSGNASVTLCHDQVSDYCPSPSQVVSTANTTIVINASKV